MKNDCIYQRMLIMKTSRKCDNSVRQNTKAVAHSHLILKSFSTGMCEKGNTTNGKNTTFKSSKFAIRIKVFLSRIISFVIFYHTHLLSSEVIVVVVRKTHLSFCLFWVPKAVDGVSIMSVIHTNIHGILLRRSVIDLLSLYYKVSLARLLFLDVKHTAHDRAKITGCKDNYR